MSLLDALLRDPLRIDGWVAKRTDAVAAPPSIPASRGIILISAEKAIVENNVIDLESAHPILWRRVGAIHLFANRTSDGKLLDGYNDLTSQWWRDAAKDVEDSLILAMI
jgi:hypothetical protein